MLSSSSRCVTLCGHQLTQGHICCFFDSRDQQYEALTPYFAEGIAQGEQVLGVLDAELHDDHHARLSKGGVPVQTAVRTGQLRTLKSDDTYLGGGRFSKAVMYRMLEDELKGIGQRGYTALRTCGDMAWALRNMPGTDELMEYESEVNDLLQIYPATFVCLYDAARVSGRAMLDIISTHSHVMIGGVVHENSYAMAPDEFRRSFLARRAATTSLRPSSSSLPSETA